MTGEIVHVPHSPSTVLVRQSRFFSALPAPLLQEMAQQFRMEEWPKGIYVDPRLLMERFYILLDGQLEMRRANPDTGREITLDMLYPGDSFDVVVLLDGKPHDVIVSPFTNLRLISAPIEIMRKWIWTYPELNQQFLPYLARKIREQEDLSANVVLYDISTRLSRIILKHINRISGYQGKSGDAHKDHLVNGFSDEVLARMVGSVRQVVNKHLQHWKAQGILNKKRNQLMIKDLEALKKEADMAESTL
ncbi:MAG TPA: Crp/Fnr family transcriptional regulator [Gammaproteobacteria bacterium]|nr:Crp/Fnr family transcriptional regulator [Gammaproteobacteria bacterium]